MLIGEVSRRAGISTRMLRHYDAIGLVSPSGRTVGGYREYSAGDIQRLFHLESLRSLGMSLRDLRRALDDPSFTPASLVADLVAATQERIGREEELLRRLRHVQHSDPTEWAEVLRVVALMRGLDSDDPSRRQRSALATAGEPVPAVRLLAEAVLEEQDPNVAGALRWALRRSSAEALEVLAPALDAADPEVRRRAVMAIADIDTADATASLRRALEHLDPTVRALAATALGARGDAGAIPGLIAMIVEGVRDVEAAEVLGALAHDFGLDDEIARALADQIDDRDNSADARWRLAQALIELHGSVAAEVLSALTDDPDRRVAMTAASFLDSRGDRETGTT